MKGDSLGQLVMTGVPGKELDAKTAELFRRVQPGAFILFGRNIETPTQLRNLIDDLRDLNDVEPIITIDQEGGRVSRLRLIGNEPRIDRTREELDQNELAVFRQFMDKVDSMMICHGWYPSLEPEKTPASLSRRVITDVLRKEFGFDGLVMTDDLDMGAILNGYGLEQ